MSDKTQHTTQVFEGYLIRAGPRLSIINPEVAGQQISQKLKVTISDTNKLINVMVPTTPDPVGSVTPVPAALIEHVHSSRKKYVFQKLQVFQMKSKQKEMM